MNEARRFLEDMVKEAFVDWRRDPLSERRMRCTAGFINDMADWAYHYHPKVKSKYHKVKEFRENMRKQHVEFHIVSDIANGTKHVFLSRPDHIVECADQVFLHKHHSMDEVLDFDSIEMFDDLNEWIVELDNGQRQSLVPLIERCIEIWEEFLCNV